MAIRPRKISGEHILDLNLRFSSFFGFENRRAMESKVSQFVFERKVAGVKGLVNVFCLIKGEAGSSSPHRVAEQSQIGLAVFSFTPR